MTCCLFSCSIVVHINFPCSDKVSVALSWAVHGWMYVLPGEKNKTMIDLFAGSRARYVHQDIEDLAMIL